MVGREVTHVDLLLVVPLSNENAERNERKKQQINETGEETNKKNFTF